MKKNNLIKILLTIPLLLTGNNTNISAENVSYLPEEKKVQLAGDVTVQINEWEFYAQTGDFLLDEKKLYLRGSDRVSASFKNKIRLVSGSAEYIEVQLDESIVLQGSAELISGQETIKSNKINYNFPE
jgi:lipopolysaccharide assembly outer membrane protein LptD (OstA)